MKIYLTLIISFTLIIIAILSVASIYSTPHELRTPSIPAERIERVDPSGRWLILNRELGIPFDQLKAMSPDEIQRLFEQNAERLRVNIYRLTRQPNGTETWIEIRGIKSPTPTLQSSTACPSIQKGLAFLKHHYVQDIGLIRESPLVSPNRFWLTNDNALAALAFSRTGEHEYAASLGSSMRRYGYSTNGLIEVLWGVPVTWPPHVEQKSIIAQVGAYQVWQEFHDSGPVFNDWQDYANLGLLGAMNEYRSGRRDSAIRIFQQTLMQFDGIGFRDKSYSSSGFYETYKLALALYVGATINVPLTDVRLSRALLAMQTTDGGFTTLYRDLHTPTGDANTETTALALLAQSVYGCLR